MRLSEVSIERPVLATVLSLLILLFGAISLLRLPNRELPDVDPPVVSVTTIFPGAAPQVVETSVTQELEDELIAIEGVKHLTSSSREQVSDIAVEFDLGRDVDLAANDVRDRVARVRRKLPDEVEEPIVAKREADASPILWLSLSGGGLDSIELSTLAETRIKDRLSKLPGVSEVIIGGERRYSIRVWVDNSKLTAQGLTVADVAAALSRENVEIPSGRIEGTGREFTVRTLGELSTPEGFRRLVLGTVAGAPVYLGDIGEVRVGGEDERKLVRYNREPAVGLGVVRQSKSNTLAVANAVHLEIAAIRGDLPAGVRIDDAYDSSIFIRRSIEDVAQTIFEAILLVVVVIYLFLRSVRATIIPVVAIPISIVGTATILDLCGFSINTLTLMGMTLAIGIVVDDAIVVLENVARWIEDGARPFEAARQGMREISFAVVATTASVVAVFLPLVFLSDKTGRLFREFGVTIAAAVAISGFVALTLSPMLCARILRHGGAERGVRAKLGRAFDRFAAAYAKLLRPMFRWRGAVIAVAVAWFVLGVALFRSVPREFIPTADRGSIFAFTRAPEGSTMAYTDRYQQDVEKQFQAIPEVDKIFSVVALGLGTPGEVNEGGIFAMLVPWEKRSRSQQSIVQELLGRLWGVPGLQAFPMNPPALGQGFSTPISLVVQGPDVQRVAGYGDALVRRAFEVPGVVNPRTDLLLNKPQVEVSVDRERAADLGVSIREVATTLQVLLGGLDLSTFKKGGETYKVMVQLPESARSRSRDLMGLYVHGRDGALVPLASVVTVHETVGPRALPHFDRFRSATVSADLAQGAALGPALERLRAIGNELLPAGEGYQMTFSGESEEFYESGHALAFAYGLAVLIVFLVLAAQFESFLDPVTVLVAVALSFTGALLGLRWTGHTLNLFSEIGLVMLVGLVTKNSILIVEFANQLRERGTALVEAAYEASRLRFRPILMTAMSTTLGILPIALGLGAGGESRAALGVAVIGGMTFSTVLTLFVVPIVYVVFAGTVERVTGRRRFRAPAEPAHPSAAQVG